MNIKKAIIFLFIFYKTAIFAGFPAQTLVKIPSGYIPIKQLAIGDTVIGRAENEFVAQKITHTKKSFAENCLVIVTPTITIITSAHQEFYMRDKQTWKKAKDLTSADLLLSEDSIPISIKTIIPLHEKIDLYDISVEYDHNFLITDCDILVHNFVPVVIGFSFAFGSGAIELVSATVGISTLIGIVGTTINTFRKKDGSPSHKISFNLGGPSGSNGNNNNDDNDKKRKKQSPLSNKEARALAKKMGFTEIKGLSRARPNELTFKRDSTIISPDKDCHKGGVWKQLNRHGDRISTWNIDLTKMIGT